jgi:hypothetical protein
LRTVGGLGVVVVLVLVAFLAEAGLGVVEREVVEAALPSKPAGGGNSVVVYSSSAWWFPQHKRVLHE